MLIERNLAPFVVRGDEPVGHALEKITANKARFIVVVSPEGLLQGTLSDGDFRRWVSSRQDARLDTPVLELRADLDRTLERLAQEVAEAEQDGADSVILGCMALFGLAPRIKANIPVVDPALAALNMATATVRMGLTNSIKN